MYALVQKLLLAVCVEINSHLSLICLVFLPLIVFSTANFSFIYAFFAIDFISLLIMFWCTAGGNIPSILFNIFWIFEFIGMRILTSCFFPPIGYLVFLSIWTSVELLSQFFSSFAPHLWSSIISDWLCINGFKLNILDF